VASNSCTGSIPVPGTFKTRSLERITISPSGPTFSRIIAGAWRWQHLTTPEVATLIQTSLDSGITTFDHADIYGDHTIEALFGRSMSGSIRNKIQLISKCGIKFPSDQRPGVYVKHYDTSAEHIIWSVENSLRNLKTDYLDLLLIHRPDPLLNPDVVASAFARLRESGKVLHVGVSNFTPSQFRLLQSAMSFPLVTNQIEISLSKTESVFNGDLDFLMERNIAPLAWSPLGGGELLSKKIEFCGLEKTNTSQLALAWLLTHPAKILPVIGTSKAERIIEAAKSTGVILNRQQWFSLMQQVSGVEVP
jgi:predicted oxidoreductase